MSSTEWPPEIVHAPETTAPSDPAMPPDLLGVIGYCSDKTMGELPGSLVSPTTVHKSIVDAKNYLFGSELENSMRSSLEDFSKVSFVDFFVFIVYF